MVEDHGFVNGDNVCDTITRVDDNTGAQTYTALASVASTASVKLREQLTLRVQGQDGLDGNVNTSESVSIKHDLAHLLPVLERVHRRLCQEDLLALRIHLELLKKSIIPEVLHVIPLLDDAVLHGIADLKHRSGGGGLVTAHDVLDHQVAVRLLLGPEDWPTDDGRVLVLGEVLRGISDLEETGTAVED